MSTKLCWSFCTADCQLRKHDGCRLHIPRYDLLPPNEGVEYLPYLKFGKRDYDDEKTQYSIALARWYKNGREGARPVHWRVTVRDPWADIYIWEDPDIILPNYMRPPLYDASDLEAFFLSQPSIIRLTHKVIEEDGSHLYSRKLLGELLTIFRLKYKERWEPWYATEYGHPAMLEVIPVLDPIAAWKKVMKVYERSVELIQQWLLLNYELFPVEWYPRIIAHCEMGERWQQRVAAADRILNPEIRPKIQRVILPDRDPDDLVEDMTAKKRHREVPIEDVT